MDVLELGAWTLLVATATGLIGLVLFAGLMAVTAVWRRVR